MSWKRLVGISVALVFSFAGGRTKLDYIQLRMAEPAVLPDEGGSLNPPVVSFQRYKAEIKTEVVDGVKRWDTEVNTCVPVGCTMTAAIGWQNPAASLRTHVELRPNSAYHVCLELPENFEYRRLALLRTKAETLYEAIEQADAKLRENTEQSDRELLTTEARQLLIDRCTETKRDIGDWKLALVQEEGDLAATRERIAELAAEVAGMELKLREDDLARDRLLPQVLVESLVDQVEDWRADLGTLKARIVALELMVANPNNPYPRVVTGWLETRDQTTFAASGAIPFVVEDEYLDWIRQDKVVTVVMYDPNEAPEDAREAARRARVPEYWPSEGLMVIEFHTEAPTVPREAAGGTKSNTEVKRNNYFNVRSQTFRGENGYLRTYLRSSDGKHMWVFGPDMTPPENVQVWLQDTNGLPVDKIYPPDARPSSETALVSQIAGIEGGALDPVREAQKRGKIVAIARLGNRLRARDGKTVHMIHSREMARALARAAQAGTR